MHAKKSENMEILLVESLSYFISTLELTFRAKSFFKAVPAIKWPSCHWIKVFLAWCEGWLNLSWIDSGGDSTLSSEDMSTALPLHTRNSAKNKINAHHQDQLSERVMGALMK